MILGECPHCDKPVNTSIANVPLPVYSKEVCPHCGKEYWLKHSRINPEAFKEKPDNCGNKIENGERV